MPQVVTSNVVPGVPNARLKDAGYRIDTKASLFTVRAFADGLISAAAHNPEFVIRDFTGDVRFHAGSLPESFLALRIKAGFFDLTNDVSRRDREAISRVLNDEVLEVQQYPEISFVSTRVAAQRLVESMFRAEIWGQLTLHGATHSLGIEAQLVLGDDTLRATGSFEIRQSDFGLKIASVAGGTMKVRDELRFCFYMLARRTPPGEGSLTAKADPTTRSSVLH